MDIYLDNNIIVSIEKGDYNLQEIEKLFPNQKLKYFYSSAHIFEADTITDKGDIDKEVLLSKRINSIRNIFKNNYLYVEPSNNKIYNIFQDPQTVYDTITLVPNSSNIMRGFMDLISFEQKEEIRSQMGLETARLNNYSPDEVVVHLSKELVSWANLSFINFIEKAMQYYPENQNLGLKNRIAGVFELLDMLGYWKDRQTENSNYARLWDAQHTFFASYCDIFICDDKKARYKANVVYNIYGKRTKVISTKDSQ